MCFKCRKVFKAHVYGRSLICTFSNRRTHQNTRSIHGTNTWVFKVTNFHYLKTNECVVISYEYIVLSRLLHVGMEMKCERVQGMHVIRKVQIVMCLWYKVKNPTKKFFPNKIVMLQRTPRKTIGRCRTRVRMMCRAFPLCLERQSSYLFSFVRLIYQFSSVICLFVQSMKVI